MLLLDSDNASSSERRENENTERKKTTPEQQNVKLSTVFSEVFKVVQNLISIDNYTRTEQKSQSDLITAEQI